ncbi:lytic transglycosylase [Vibrio tubiashii]|nr:lytic transglycosylase [Vibrio tubiashii]
MLRKIVLTLSLFSSVALANSHKQIYEDVEQKHNIPKEVLYALALTETGITTDEGQFMPWSYTLNWRGISYRFNSKSSACESLEWILTVSNAVDIGETQLHWKYHNKATGSACDYFDRDIAINRSAEVMNDCYKKHSNWIKAAGCYHRPAGGELAKIYEMKYLTHLKNVLNQEW